jgi:hypothetical protein
VEETKETAGARTIAPTKFSDYYEWIGREDTKEYMQSIQKWRDHTNSEHFATEFNNITTRFREDNDKRTE